MADSEPNSQDSLRRGDLSYEMEEPSETIIIQDSLRQFLQFIIMATSALLLFVSWLVKIKMLHVRSDIVLLPIECGFAVIVGYCMYFIIKG
jgi:hypothetical protein